MVLNDFDISTWVLVHKTWLDGQKGNKGMLRWTGPYIVHEKFNNKTYRLWEIDGAIRRDTIDKHCLKIFYSIQTRPPNNQDHFRCRIPDCRSYGERIGCFDMLGSLYGDSFVGTNYPQSLTTGFMLTPFNLDLSHPISILAHGSSSQHIPLSDLDNSDCSFANLHTSCFNPHQCLLPLKIYNLNIQFLTYWACDYVPWYWVEWGCSTTRSLVTWPTFFIHMLTHHSQAYFSLCTLDMLTALSPTHRSTFAELLYKSLASIYQHCQHQGNKKEGCGMVMVDKQWSASFDSLTPFFLYFLFPFSHVTSWMHTIQLHKEKHRSPSCMNSGQ